MADALAPPPPDGPDTGFLVSKLNQIQDGRTGLVQAGVSDREVDVMSWMMNKTGNATRVAEAYKSGFVTEFSLRDGDNDKVLTPAECPILASTSFAGRPGASMTPVVFCEFCARRRNLLERVGSTGIVESTGEQQVVAVGPSGGTMADGAVSAEHQPTAFLQQKFWGLCDCFSGSTVDNHEGTFDNHEDTFDNHEDTFDNHDDVMTDNHAVISPQSGPRRQDAGPTQPGVLALEDDHALRQRQREEQAARDKEAATEARRRQQERDIVSDPWLMAGWLS
ncbi:unnamed protein product [Amoebophrya sp. A120]|nr:unnamed protein product [Amoebophrya sp. A120]|eukprot:GSA120T00016126001.1